MTQMGSETLSGYVQAKERTKSGKAWKLKLNGKYISVSNRANMDGVDQGVYVEYRLGGFNGNDGKWVETIDAIRPAKAPQGSTPPASGGSGANAASRLASAHWDDSALRFLSNIVGSAITAGIVKDPVEVLAWTRAAEESLKNLGQAQAPTGGAQQNSGSAPKEEFPFDDSEGLEQLMPRGSNKEPNW